MRIFLSFIVITLFVSTLSATELKILKPNDRGKAYDIAATEFQKFYEKCTGVLLPITTEPNDTDDFVVIGSDAVNRFCRTVIEKKIIPGFLLRTGTDDYHILSAKDGKRHLLFLAGGKGRSTLYAVYHFFETRGGCSYFWDGDVVPKTEKIDLTNLNIVESPRFEYRGLRYFAHRSLTRFQAEHWGPKDWEQEIDWMLKKRLNVFMLRIGMDDVFQKAFPDIVPYPDNNKPLSGTLSGYDDRTTFWSLKYRGELRKYILRYAFDRELMHPEDFGTMTHWYSRTPISFLEQIKPTFLLQAEAHMADKTGLVWDIREDRNLDMYFKLTETHIEQYGKPELFHTIGLAERRMFRDPDDDIKLKKYVYRRLIAKLREKYPDAPLLLASWDFYGWWKPKDVEELLKELDPARTIIWDYTADLPSTGGTHLFNDSVVIGKFPYVFGVFEAYEPSSDIRIDYDLIGKRTAFVAEDSFCKGYIYWPEVSHTDILFLDYFPKNAWKPNEYQPDQSMERICKARYGQYAGVMLENWKRFLPYHEITNKSLRFWDYFVPNRVFEDKNWHEFQTNRKRVMGSAPELLRSLAALPFHDNQPFLKRDVIDLARTTVNNLAALPLAHTNIALKSWREGVASKEEVQSAMQETIRFFELFRDLLSLHEDYSMNVTLERLKTINEVNPCFEKTLIANGVNGYCYSYIYEFFDGFYIPVLHSYAGLLNRIFDTEGERKNLEAKLLNEQFIKRQNEMHQHFLKDFIPPQATPERYQKTLLSLAEITKTLLEYK
jgi:hypothetical protein